jgi:hypothetical protein
MVGQCLSNKNKSASKNAKPFWSKQGHSRLLNEKAKYAMTICWRLPCTRLLLHGVSSGTTVHPIPSTSPCLSPSRLPPPMPKSTRATPTARAKCERTPAHQTLLLWVHGAVVQGWGRGTRRKPGVISVFADLRCTCTPPVPATSCSRRQPSRSKTPLPLVPLDVAAAKKGKAAASGGARQFWRLGPLATVKLFSCLVLFIMQLYKNCLNQLVSQ